MLVSVAAAVFAILLVLVRLQWAPLERLDHDVAAGLNSRVAGHPVFVFVVKGVTWLGSGAVLWTIILGCALGLAIRARWYLAAYLAVTGAGALVLDPTLKFLVGRARPMVAHPVAHADGNSFPSGHSLGSTVCYGAVLLVFVPALGGRWRAAFTSGAVALVGLIGVSRLLLGVHFVSDVVAGWAAGVAWVGVTAYAFKLSRLRPPR